jgi:pimeloyl-ACP methyl ester carboxylesterase
MPGAGAPGERLELVEHAFRTLPERYLGAPAGFDAVYQVRLGDLGRTWEVHCTEKAARVRRGATGREPDVVIGADAGTWLRLREGELSGISAFSRRLLYVRGDLDRAVAFEGLFHLPNGRPPLLRIHDVELPGRRISTLTMGEGGDVICLHGLGATKASFFDTAAALTAAGHRVHVIDLPGFGSSSKPALAPYSPRWFADTVRGRRGVRAARLSPAGAPAATGARAAAAPLRPRDRRQAVLEPVRRLRPRGPQRRRHRRRRVPADLLERRRPARVPGRGAQHLPRPPLRPRRLLPAARRAPGPVAVRLGPGRPHHPPAFSRHVARWLPSAEQLVLEGCGHVPQVEKPEQTNGALVRFFARIDALRALPAPGAPIVRAA